MLTTKQKLFLINALRFGGMRCIVAIAMAVAGRWGARCLGPEKLGVSTMIVALVSQAALLLGIFPDALLVRKYKELNSAAERLVLYYTVFYARIALATLVVLLALVYIWWWGVPDGFGLAAAVGVALLYFRALSPSWVYQASEKMQVLAVIELLTPVGIVIGYSLYMRPGVSAGADLLVQALVGIVVIAIMLRFASRISGAHEADNTISLISWRLARDLVWGGKWLIIMQTTIYVYAGFEVALVGYLLGVDIAGQYRTAQAWALASSVVISLPPLLLFPRFVEWRKRSPELLWGRQLKIAGVMAAISIFSIILILNFVPVFHIWWFGSIYSPAAKPAAVLLSAKMIVLVNGIFAWGVVSDSKKDHLLAMCMAGVAVLSLGLDLWAIPEFGMMGAALISVLSELLILVAVIFLSRPAKLKTVV